eukprot:5072225-Pleurochrysis_carterae.AAC.10
MQNTDEVSLEVELCSQGPSYDDAITARLALADLRILVRSARALKHCLMRSPSALGMHGRAGAG